ncbi:MAG: acetylornithine transaminase [bacterium]|nr:acetylornithine transaminase [bacterium]
MDTSKIIEMTDEYCLPTYRRFPVAFVRGQGVKLYDPEGKEYLDFVAGLAVNTLGHAHPRLVEAISEQARNLIHTSNLYHIEPQARLARRLSNLSFGGKVFFCNSGAEANEAAIKLARLFGKKQGQRYEIITATNSFHGRTMITLTATGQSKFHKGFDPLPPGFVYVPFNDLTRLQETISDSTCAIMLEPIQGEGGVNVATIEYLKGVRELCDQKGLLLIFDEVQTGIGRTGKFFAYEHYGIVPDVITLAKGLGGGVPIGAMIADSEIASLLGPGTHASTFGGNFLATSAALVVLDVIEEDNLLQHVREVGTYLKNGLDRLAGKYPVIKEVRGKGLMMACELEQEGSSIVMECLQRGVLINCTMDKVLRFLPPLIVTVSDVDQMLDVLDGVFSCLK